MSIDIAEIQRGGSSHNNYCRRGIRQWKFAGLGSQRSSFAGKTCFGSFELLNYELFSALFFGPHILSRRKRLSSKICNSRQACNSYILF
jgi:hypothetical protein